jgi:hypothetical protein
LSGPLGNGCDEMPVAPHNAIHLHNSLAQFTGTIRLANTGGGGTIVCTPGNTADKAAHAVK